MAQCDDFGVQSDDHYRALKAVLMQDSSEDFEVGDLFEVDEFFAYLSKIEIRKFQELEQALGYGERLNQLVKKYAPEYVGVVTFRTIWDEQRELEAELKQVK
jgi:predicted HAD superfamily phosphohydrolase